MLTNGRQNKWLNRYVLSGYLFYDLISNVLRVHIKAWENV